MTTVPRNKVSKIVVNPEPENTETSKLIFHMKNDLRRRQNLDPGVESLD